MDPKVGTDERPKKDVEFIFSLKQAALALARKQRKGSRVELMAEASESGDERERESPQWLVISFGELREPNSNRDR